MRPRIMYRISGIGCRGVSFVGIIIFRQVLPAEMYDYVLLCVVGRERCYWGLLVDLCTEMGRGSADASSYRSRARTISMALYIASLIDVGSA